MEVQVFSTALISSTYDTVNALRVAKCTNVNLHVNLSPLPSSMRAIPITRALKERRPRGSRQHRLAPALLEAARSYSGASPFRLQPIGMEVPDSTGFESGRILGQGSTTSIRRRLILVPICPDGSIFNRMRAFNVPPAVPGWRCRVHRSRSVSIAPGKYSGTTVHSPRLPRRRPSTLVVPIEGRASAIPLDDVWFYR